MSNLRLWGPGHLCPLRSPHPAVLETSGFPRLGAGGGICLPGIEQPYQAPAEVQPIPPFAEEFSHTGLCYFGTWILVEAKLLFP